MKYDIIYADPPWSFKTYSEKGKEKKSAELHYDCMTIDDIYKLPVGDIASDNSMLFIWVTNPMLPEGLETIKQWGFTYKTVAFSWYKKNRIANTPFFGLGYWTRANVELCLLATKGRPKRIYSGVSQVVQSLDVDGWNTEQVFSVIRKHSQKPDEIRTKIVQLCGDLPRVELFARERVEGWSAWGNEIQSDPLFGV